MSTKYFIEIEAPIGPEIAGGSLESQHRDPERGLRVLGALVQERGLWSGPIILDLPEGIGTRGGEW